MGSPISICTGLLLLLLVNHSASQSEKPENVSFRNKLPTGSVDVIIELLSFENTEHLRFDGQTCDIWWLGNIDRCDHIFDFCLSSNQGRDCDIAKKVSAGEHMGEVTVFKDIAITSGHFFNHQKVSWKSATLGLKVEDRDVVGRDLVDEFTFEFDVKPRANKTITVSGSQLSGSRLNLSLSISCSEFHFGPECDIYCKPVPGSVDCSKTGNALCLNAQCGGLVFPLPTTEGPTSPRGPVYGGKERVEIANWDVQLQMISYSNPESKTNARQSCDKISFIRPNDAICDVVFDICLKTPGSQTCNMIKRQTDPFQAISKTFINFSEESIFDLAVINREFSANSWPDADLAVVVEDVDGNLGRDFIDIFKYSFKQTKVSGPVQMEGAVSKLQVALNVSCARHYYGDDCKTYCVPVLSFFDCSADGKRICYDNGLRVLDCAIKYNKTTTNIQPETTTSVTLPETTTSVTLPGTTISPSIFKTVSLLKNCEKTIAISDNEYGEINIGTADLPIDGATVCIVKFKSATNASFVHLRLLSVDTPCDDPNVTVSTSELLGQSIFNVFPFFCGKEIVPVQPTHVAPGYSDVTFMVIVKQPESFKEPVFRMQFALGDRDINQSKVIWPPVTPNTQTTIPTTTSTTTPTTTSSTTATSIPTTTRTTMSTTTPTTTSTTTTPTTTPTTTTPTTTTLPVFVDSNQVNPASELSGASQLAYIGAVKLALVRYYREKYTREGFNIDTVNCVHSGSYIYQCTTRVGSVQPHVGMNAFDSEPEYSLSRNRRRAKRMIDEDISSTLNLAGSAAYLDIDSLHRHITDVLNATSAADLISEGASDNSTIIAMHQNATVSIDLIQVGSVIEITTSPEPSTTTSASLSSTVSSNLSTTTSSLSSSTGSITSSSTTLEVSTTLLDLSTPGTDVTARNASPPNVDKANTNANETPRSQATDRVTLSTTTSASSRPVHSGAAIAIILTVYRAFQFCPL